VRPRGFGGQLAQDEAPLRQSKHKTDEVVDAENLARLARLDPRLLYPLKHRGEDSQAHLALIRSRQALVDCRTQLVNHLPKEP
jgi:transposase